MNEAQELKNRIPQGILSCLAFLLGLFSTMPILGVVIAGRDVSFYRILFVLCVAWYGVELLRKRKLGAGRNIRLMELWLLVGLVGCLSGRLFLKGEWAPFGAAAGSYIPKVGLLLVFCVVWSSSEEADALCEKLMHGFLLGCALNCLWASIDAVGYYLKGVSVSNVLFYDYAVRNGVREHTVSLIFHGTIRSGGFNYDPAQLGFLAPVLFGCGLSRRKLLPLLLSLAGIAASASTTGLVAAALICLLAFRRGGKLFDRRSLAELGVFAVLLAALLILRGDRILPLASDMLRRFSDRIRHYYLNDSGPDIRVRYVLQMFGAMRAVLPFLLFGSGFGTASLGYVKTPEVLAVIGPGHAFPYDMENTFLAYFFDTGLVGFALFIALLLILFLRWRKKYAERESAFADSVYITICATALSMLFYHYILFAPQMLVLTVALSRLDREDRALRLATEDPEETT